MRSAAAALGLALLAALASAQPSPAPSPAPPAAETAPVARPSPAPSDDYRVGAGDVLGVTVFGNEDLSRVATVQTSGTIFLPLLGEVRVAGLTVSEIGSLLTEALGRDYLVDPHLEVRVAEYHSQLVTVLGEVNSPGRKQLRGRTRLVDVLVEAGGFRPTASGDLTITRREGEFEGGERILRIRLGGGSPTVRDQVNLELVLRHGDTIVAAPKTFVTVSGEVNRPNRYVIEGDLTVSGAVALAGGLTRFGSQKVELRRQDPETQQALPPVTVNLKDVRKGKKPDPALRSGDEVYAPRRKLL